MHQALYYSFKIWITTIVLGAVCCLVFLGSPPGDVRYDEVAVTLFLLVLISTFYSIPCFLGLMFGTYILSARIHNPLFLKLAISAVSLILCLLLFVGLACMGWQSQGPILVFVERCYPVIVLAGIWFYKLEVNRDTVPELKD